MYNMSFMLTPDQILAESKTVTRRLGWAHLKPGQFVQACRKCQGLGKGGKIERLRVIQVVSRRTEALQALIDDPEYGQSEIIKEGFNPDRWTPENWADWFCGTHKGCTRETLLTRIEIEYPVAEQLAVMGLNTTGDPLAVLW